VKEKKIDLIFIYASRHSAEDENTFKGIDVYETYAIDTLSPLFFIYIKTNLVTHAAKTTEIELCLRKKTYEEIN
jgi:hypothetical protein